MRGDAQVRFGGRTRETHQLKGWQGALARPYERHEAPLDRVEMKGLHHRSVAAGL